MCKYCEFTYVNEEIGERSNENKDIDYFEEGPHILCLSMNRYDDGDGYPINELILEHMVELQHTTGLHTVVDKHIPINYCPFCGEKL